MALLDALFGQRAQAPGAMQQPSGLAGLLDPAVALPMAAGLLGNQGNSQNFANAFGFAAPAFAEQKKLKAQTAKDNQTIEFFRAQAPEYAQMIDAGMPVSQAWETYTKQKFGGTGNATDDMREYEMAKQQGFQGSFMDYQVKMKEAGRQQVNIDTGVKLPSGFRWRDPNNQDLGVEPIPGGPGEQMPAELAARIGLAQDVIKKLDSVEQAAASGELTGPVDWGMGKMGKGRAGELNRELAAGAEALTRMLTGAGMNMAEAQREANLYLPQPWDDAPTLANKVQQLKRRLQGTVEMAGRGRGVEAVQTPQNDGWTDLGNGIRIRRVE
jgi:hypothetical protein